MKNRIMKRILVLGLSAAMVMGNLTLASAGVLSKSAVSDTSSSAAALQADVTGTISGGGTITADGTYSITSGSTGLITVSATNVTLVDTDGSTYTDLGIACTTPGTKLTLQNMKISNSATFAYSTVDYTGTGNYLYVSGTNVLDKLSNYKAAIHVAPGVGLTIDSSPADTATGSLYFYKTDTAAGIGGNDSQANGNITIAGGNIFGKGSKTGAVIGSGGSAAAQDPGNISISGGNVNLIGMAKGALIGGGNSSTASTAGGKVYVSGGYLNLNVDFMGAGIGGGGFTATSDALDGKLIVTGGSVRTYIDANAISSWTTVANPITAAGVNDVAVTADKLDGNGNAVALLKLDTSNISGSTFDVKVDGNSFYSGGLTSYSYINEALDKNSQLTPSATPDNWTAGTDKNLYLYVTKADHTVTINGFAYKYTWNSSTNTFDLIQTVATGKTGEGTVAVSNSAAAAGETVTVTATPATGYYLSQVRIANTDNGSTSYAAVKQAQDGSYSFTMPSGTVAVYADFISKVWDGTIDISWYDPSATTYDLKYAAQLAGAAALDNGLFNNYPTVSDGNGHYVPDLDAGGHPNGYSSTLYNSFKSTGASANSTAVVGNCTYLTATKADDASATSVSALYYYYGSEDFSGKTIKLDADFDMGGSYTGSKTDAANWTGPLYMPVSGQYIMDTANGCTRIDAAFQGTFDGQGHIVKNIYCDRRISSSNFKDSQSIGLIGRMGLVDSASASLYQTVTVKNVAVDGYISGGRSVGGVVGKNGKSTSSSINSCLNFATVQNTDSKGVGGIIGSGWNSLTIKDCANYGYIYTSYKNAGGISGSFEGTATDCYNIGYVGASSADAAQSLGTNNAGTALWTNCYYLTGSSASTTYPAVYNPTTGSTVGAASSADQFQLFDSMNKLSQNTDDWLPANKNLVTSDGVAAALKNVSSLSSALTAYDATSIAIPKVFTKVSGATVTGLETTGTPNKIIYYTGETFNPGTLTIYVDYSDGTKIEMTDYSISYENGGDSVAAGDKKISVAASFAGKMFMQDYPITAYASEAAYQAVQVDALIEKIGTVTTSSGDAIFNARTAYDALSDAAKALVTKYSVLTADETQYNTITSSYTVAFDVYGGKKLSKSSVTVKYGDKIGTLPSTTRAGYNFAGWYTGKSGGSKIASSTICTANVTYYAHWTKVTVSSSTITKLTAGSKKFTVNYKSVSGAKGYQIRYATKASMSSSKVKALTGTSTTVTGLSKGKTYYVQVRVYNLDSAGGKVYASWSAKKSVKVK